MLRLRYRIVDVFSDRPLAGNALCVVLDPTPAPLMQAVAREFNLSETAFPVVTGDGEYDVRIFTPETEMLFAGHPTIGTAWVLGPGRWRQTTEGATVTVEADESGARMEVPFPVLTEVHAADASRALGLDPAAAPQAWVGEIGGTRHLVVPTDSPIGRLRPDLQLAARATRAVRAGGLVALTRRGDGLHVRVFLPGAGIPEDPGTGSAAPMAAVLAGRLWQVPGDVSISQGEEMGRPCRIEVSVGDGSVWVGGRVAACAEGELTLAP